MKALKITCSHGRIWVAETSGGVRAQASTIEGCLNQLLPLTTNGNVRDDGYDALRHIFDSIRDSGDAGIARKGQVSG